MNPKRRRRKPTHDDSLFGYFPHYAVMRRSIERKLHSFCANSRINFSLPPYNEEKILTFTIHVYLLVKCEDTTTKKQRRAFLRRKGKIDTFINNTTIFVHPPPPCSSWYCTYARRQRLLDFKKEFCTEGKKVKNAFPSSHPNVLTSKSGDRFDYEPRMSILEEPSKRVKRP